jgi:predicted PolB exonuclease-like 3'-5' exonuclease
MDKSQTNAVVFLDIETVPSADSFTWEKPPRYLVGKHGSLKDPEKIKEWEEQKYKELCNKAKEDAEKEWRSESLKPYKGRIFCISYAIGDGEVKTINFLKGEKEMLLEFYKDIAPYRTLNFVGVNVEEFDLLFLFHRSLHFSLMPLANLIRSDKGYSKDRNWDVMYMASGGLAWKYKISLDNLCNLLSIETSKDDINGSEVLDTYLKGEHDRICTYCAKDVDRTRRIFYILK